VAPPPLPDLWAVSMPARPKLADPGQLIRDAKRRTDTYDLCTDPDLVGEHEDLLARLAVERAKASDSLDGGGEAAALQEQLANLAERIAAVTVTLTFAALPRPRYRALVDAHPPVKDEDGEITDGRSKRIGVDYDTFFVALVRPSLVAPELDDETLTYMMDEVLTASGWRDLSTVLWNLNESTVDVPFSPAVSARTRTSSPK
jgi:hypothetical protein